MITYSRIAHIPTPDTIKDILLSMSLVLDADGIAQIDRDELIEQIDTISGSNPAIPESIAFLKATLSETQDKADILQFV